MEGSNFHLKWFMHEKMLLKNSILGGKDGIRALQVHFLGVKLEFLAAFR